MICRILLFVVVVIEFARDSSRWSPKRRGMRAGEGIDDLGERAQVKME